MMRDCVNAELTPDAHGLEQFHIGLIILVADFCHLLFQNDSFYDKALELMTEHLLCFQIKRIESFGPGICEILKQYGMN